MTDPTRDANPARDAGPTEDPSYVDIVWGQFQKRPVAWFSLYGVVGLFLIAIYAPLLASSRPFFWSVDGGAMAFPWFWSLYDRNFFESSVDLFFNSVLFPGTVIFAPLFWLWHRWRGLSRKRRLAKLRRGLAACTLVWLACLAALAAARPMSPQVDYRKMETSLVSDGHLVSATYPPFPYSFREGEIRSDRAMTLKHPLGTDQAGRDVFTRLLYGTRISLTVGVFAVAIYCTIGIILGAVAGFFGGAVDTVILRLIEVVICVPSLFLVLTVAAFIEERSIFHIMIIIAAVSWTGPARLVRAEFLRLRELDFVAAARAAGFGRRALIFQEILPNAIGPVLVTATFGVASAILIESTMSFLGLGDITVPSWGQILSAGRSSNIWPMILAPGFAIFVTVSLLNLVGEGVRDALDPKLRQ